ncbi:hypothetical protein Dsin_016241 [Dipteronia sinensis]|uniref:Reverse transcriptase n=1 Tax=Dipteronia sinensis TaxID=43782 RepID=A0AAE0E5T0_9ROSI|nr:hypothetical protein Dsin_016241 [Dipteronia sinensis]
MSSTKVLGMDEILPLFYQKYWGTVGEGITKDFLCYLNDGESHSAVNGTLIILIPKTQNHEILASFRPISLCNVAYKIIAKSLANGFRGVLREVISETKAHSSQVILSLTM